jgi:hypothetical protein
MMVDDDKTLNRTKKSKARRPKQRFGLFEFVLGAICCVGLPGLMTAIAPVSWLEFNRVDHQVKAEARTCVFFFFPYRTQQLTDVRNVSTAFRLGDEQHRRPGDKKRGRAESEGTIRLHGPQGNAEAGQTISVSVSPASYKAIEAQIQKFLADPQQRHLTLFTVANWKFGIFFAIPVCLLTVLFVVGWSIWLAQALASPFLKLFSGPVNERWEENQEPDRS